MSNRLLIGRAALAEPDEWLPARRQPRRGLPLWTEVRAAWRRHRSRQSIAGLDDHLLKDIGVSFAEAEAEANKSFWRA